MFRCQPDAVLAAEHWVCPGARVDDGDGAGTPIASGPSDAEASATLSLPSGGSGYWVAFFFSSRRRHTRFDCDWSSDVCSSDLATSRPTGPVTLVLPAGRWNEPARASAGPPPARPEPGPGDAADLSIPEHGDEEIGRASCRERV